MNGVSSPLEIRILSAPLHSFFKYYMTDNYVVNTAKNLDDVSKDCSYILKSSKADENDLRNAVFNELINRKLNLEFPTEAKSPKKDIFKRIRNFLLKKKTVLEPSSEHFASENKEGPFAYKENNVGVALSNISKLIVPNPYKKDINKLEQGLLVTATSKPDMMVLNPISNEGKQKLYELIQGEFKHAATYNMRNAERQCFAYLYAALYWFRVVQGFPLKSVYGFGVCGHKCSGLEKDTYAVGFFRLTAPSNLGEECKAEKCWLPSSTTDQTGLKLLILFLTSPKPENILSSDCEVGRVKEGFPALLSAPYKYWKHPGLVRNGTRAIVFHLNFQDMLAMLEDLKKMVMI